jgi:hypothetical protein
MEKHTGPLPTTDTPIELTAAGAYARWGKSERWWPARLPELVRSGVAAKRGRTFWARPSRVEAWLCGELTERREKGRGTRSGHEAIPIQAASSWVG